MIPATRTRSVAATVTALAFACAAALAPARAARADDAVVIERDGKPGIWLPLEAHRAILADLGELAERRQEVHLLDEKLHLRVEQMRDLRIAVESATAAQKAAVGALEAAERGRVAAEARLDAWYRSPTLWFGIGVVVSLGLVVGIARLVEAR